MQDSAMRYEALSEYNWQDFEELFGPKGACAGCWCTHWRRPRKDHEANKGEGNRLFMKELAQTSEPIGLILYHQDTPAAWISIAPREKFAGLKTSRVLKPVDEQPVWSISCFFVAKNYRRQGLGAKCLQAAIDFARKNSVSIIEGYPIDPKKDNMPTVFAWTGFVQPFIECGFKEVARRSETRPIMRYDIQQE